MFYPRIVAQYSDFTVSHGCMILCIQYSIYNVNGVRQEANGTERVWCCH